MMPGRPTLSQDAVGPSGNVVSVNDGQTKQAYRKMKQTLRQTPFQVYRTAAAPRAGWSEPLGPKAMRWFGCVARHYTRIGVRRPDTVGTGDEAVEEVREGAGLQSHHIPPPNRIHRPIDARAYCNEFPHLMIVGYLSKYTACRVELLRASKSGPKPDYRSVRSIAVLPYPDLRTDSESC